MSQRYELVQVTAEEFKTLKARGVSVCHLCCFGYQTKYRLNCLDIRNRLVAAAGQDSIRCVGKEPYVDAYIRDTQATI